jgi:trans-aconitate 2-methyltransferase
MNQAREWDSTSYHRLSDRQFGWGLKVLERFSLRGDETVLDAGCGSGRVTAELASCLPRGRLIAVDLSENMVHSAREHLGTRVGPAAPGRAAIALACADLAALPFLGAFDLIFSTATFHWVKDHERLFRSLFQALKPGGRLEAQCGGGPNLARLRRRASALMAQPPYARFFVDWQDPWNYADPDLTPRRLRAAGFLDVESWLEPAAFKLTTAEEYRQYLATVTLHRHVARITDADLRDRFLTDLAQQAISDPDFELDYWRLNIRARKPA